MQVKREWNLFMRLKKRYCPKCNVLLRVIKCEEIVDSKSDKAQEYDFSTVDSYLFGKVKFIWDELKCPACGSKYNWRKYQNMDKYRRHK